MGEIVGAARPRTIPQRQSREVEAGGPALGLRTKQLELLGGQRERERIVEQSRGLGVAEAQLVAHDLAQLAARAQARDIDRRLDPRRDHQVRHDRQVSEHEADALVDRRVPDHVVVVEHEDVLLRRGDERVEQERQRGFPGRGPGAASAASKADGTSTPAFRRAAAT